MRNVIFNPIRLYIAWTAVSLIFGLLIPTLSASHDLSSQAPFVLGTYTLIGLICGNFAISILNMILFKKWLTRFWYINWTVFLVCGSIIVYFFIKIITL